LTYIIIHMNDIAENDFSGGKRKKRDSDVSTASQSSSCNIVAMDLTNRRQSQISAKFRARRAESIKNDHVFFADEINDDDEKFTPNTGINDSEVEGILQKTAATGGRGLDVQTIEPDYEVPSLNSFDKSQPLDDLLIRRRSLHSSPANSRSGSRSGSVRISAPDGADSENDDDDRDAAAAATGEIEDHGNFFFGQNGA